MKTIILKSLLGAAILAGAAHASAQITFYEGEGFRGPDLRDRPREVWNFDRTGFNDRASLVIVDRGRWECLRRRLASRVAASSCSAAATSRSAAWVAGQIAPRRCGRSIRAATDDNVAPEPLAAPTYDYRRRPNERLFGSARHLGACGDGPAGAALLGRVPSRSSSPSGATSTCRARVIGGVLGGILGHQIGGGTGRPSPRSAAPLPAARSAPTSAGTTPARSARATAPPRERRQRGRPSSGTDLRLSRRPASGPDETPRPGRTVVVNRDGRAAAVVLGHRLGWHRCSARLSAARKAWLAAHFWRYSAVHCWRPGHARCRCPAGGIR